MRARGKSGYTLVELIVVVLIVGILASFGVPQYLKTVESGKADDAVAVVNMLGTTNKMFALDHSGYYAVGGLPTDASDSRGGACQNTACPATVSGNVNACVLVACKYLAAQDWVGKPYSFRACDPTDSSPPGACAWGSGVVAAAGRKTTGDAGTSMTPYRNWRYTIDRNGVVTALNGAPTPAY